MADNGTGPSWCPGLSADHPWPDDPADVVERLPKDWLEETARGTKAKSWSTKLLPMAVQVDARGWLGEGGVRAWWVPTPFRLCLHCGVSYGGRTKSDFTKLTTLVSEGRSTATTVLSLATVRSLRADTHLGPAAKKLLSFTDNRQAPLGPHRARAHRHGPPSGGVQSRGRSASGLRRRHGQRRLVRAGHFGHRLLGG